MKIKTAEAIGPALDWLAATALAIQCNEQRVIKIRRVEETTPAWIERENSVGSAPYYHRFSPSTDWAQGGPIIEREGISIRLEGREDMGWYATVGARGELAFTCLPMADAGGPTPLIAAMRCYVASKLGDEVEIPEELVV